MNKFILYCITPILSIVIPLNTIAMQGMTGQSFDDYLISLSLEELMNMTITTPSKHKENIRDTPSTVIVVTKQQILSRRYVNLIDLIRDLPGTDVQFANDETRYHNVTLRGHLGNNKFLILQNGFRIDSPTGEIIPIAQNFPLYYAKQVEIVYGPAAALYGADAFGGVINIVTEDGDGIDGAELSTSVGEDGYRYNYLRLGGYVGEEFKFTIGGHLHSADNADLSEYYPHLFTKSDAITTDGRLVIPAQEREDYYAATESRSLHAKLEAFKNFTFGFNYNKFTSPSSTGNTPHTALYIPEAVWETKLASLYAKYHHDWTGNLTSDTNIYYSRFEIDPRSRFNNLFTDFQPGYKYSKGRKQGIEQQITYLFNEKNTLTLGIGYENYYSLPRTADLATAFDSTKGHGQQELYYVGTNDNLPVVFLDTEYNNRLAYVQLRSNWRENLATTLGVRYDKSSSYGSTINPRLGLVYRATNDTTIKLLYGRGFRAPSPHESYSTYGSFSGQQNENGEYISPFFRVPNPNLKPEQVATWEFNILKEFSKDFNLSLSGYSTRITDVISGSDLSYEPVQFIPGGYIQTGNYNDNLESGRYYGLDAGLQYQYYFGSGFGGNFWANYSFIDGNMLGSDGIKRDLTYVAKHKFKLGATINYQQNYFVTPKLYMISKTNTNKFDVNSDNDWLRSPGYVVMDLHFGAVEVWRGLSVLLDIHNLFDTRYYNAGSITQATTFLANPQPPRTITLSLKYKF